jgi:hypothetical protein
VADADREWTNWLVGLLKAAAARFDVHLVDQPAPGLRGRTIGAHATDGLGDWWVRVVTELAGWGYGPAWTGNADANQIAGVPHPRVENCAEWDEPEAGRRVRAELLTLAPGSTIASEIVLRAPVRLDEAWWRQLRDSLHALAGQPTDRVCLEPDLLARRILAAFGVAIEPGALTWTTAHGDLHWANLTNPGCWLLDWESWGTAPAGYDAALLHAASLLEPATATRVYATFADVLDGPAGAVAQLAAAAKLLGLVEYGDHPDLAVPLHRYARSLVATYFDQPA